MKVNIRIITLKDAQRIMEIYNHYIMNTVFTFETEALTEEQVKKRIEKYANEYPWYVGESDSKVIGYAYASEFVERSHINIQAKSRFLLIGITRRAEAGRRCSGN